MYFKLDINVRTDKLLEQWNYKGIDPHSYNIYDIFWSDKVIIENDEIKQLLKGVEKGGLQSEERLRQIAREIEGKISDFLLKNFILTYFETSIHEDGTNLSTVEETWKRLVKYADMDTITLPTTQGFIDATVPYVGIYSYSERYSNVTHYYLATRNNYIVSIITKEGIEWLHDYLKKVEEKVPNLAEIATINTEHTAEVECNTDCNCNCGY
jgi:hypothetical protein